MKATVTLDTTDVVVQAAPPTHVSQRTSEAVLGIHRRAYLEALPLFEAAGGQVLTLGRLRIVDRLELLGWLASRERSTRSPGIASGESSLARELGLPRVS